MIFSKILLERLLPPSDAEMPSYHRNIFCDTFIITLALCLVTVCISCFSVYFAYLWHNKSVNLRILNVLYGNLALNMQLLSLLFVSTILTAVMETNSVKDNTISTLEAVRVFAETNQALLVAQLTLVTCVKVWRPELYLALSLKWRNEWTLLLNLTVVTGFLAWVGVPGGKEDATIGRIIVVLGSMILLAFITQLVIIMKETSDHWKKLTRRLLCWSGSCLGPGPTLVLPYVEEVVIPDSASQVMFI